MTTSRSIASTSRHLLAIAAALVALVAFARPADARKRVVVLDFSGPKAEQFQAQVTGVIKRSHSVVPVSKWNDAADELGASMNAKGIAKVAGKINVDGVVTGSVDRRGTRYFVHVKLKSGATGEQVASVELVTRSGKLSSSDLDEVKEQIVGAIESLEAPSGGDDGDDSADDDAPRSKGKDKHKAKGKHKLDDSDDDSATASDDDAPKAKGKDKDKHKGFRGKDSDDSMSADDDASASDDGDDAPKSKSKAKGKDKSKSKGKHVATADDDDASAADDASDDDAPKGKSKSKSKDKDKDKSKSKGKHKDDDTADADDSGDKDRDADRDRDRDKDRVADRDAGDDSSDDEAVGAEADLAPSAQHRPLDALAGFSFTGRRLSFTTSPGLANAPKGYRSGLPVTGIFLDADLYPLAFNAKNHSITRDLGLTVMFDRVLSISSQYSYTNMGTSGTATLATTEQHLALGVVFRHALGKGGALDPTLFASIRYNRSKFVIDKGAVPMGVPPPDIPNTDYTYIDPGVAIRYPLNPKLALDGGVRFDLITNTGEMQQPDQYGGATVYGFDLDAGADYALNKQWFVHGGLKLSTIGFSFKGNGALSNNRDGDPTTVDVSGARDTYYGAMVTAGYLY